MRIEELGDILSAHNIVHGAGVPCSYFTPLVNHVAATPQLRYVSATSEGEAVAIAAGLTAGGCPAFAIMQNSGLGNAVNPITSLIQVYQIPVTLLVSHRGQPGLADEPQHELMGQITEALCELCGLQTHVFDPNHFATQLGAAQQRQQPIAFVVRKGSLEGGTKAPVTPPVLHSTTHQAEQLGDFRAELSREDALRRLLPLLNGTGNQTPPLVIATTGKLSRELYELDDTDHSRSNRFYMVGSMGCALAFGLGVARAQPDRKVIVLDGDGALLMKLGSLATVGSTGPSNLHHVVLDNGAHDSTGGQPTPSPAVDFATMALAAGYQRATTVAEPERLATTLDQHLSAAGPTLMRVAILVGARKDLGRPNLHPKDAYQRFVAHVAGKPWAGPQHHDTPEGTPDAR